MLPPMRPSPTMPILIPVPLPVVCPLLIPRRPLWRARVVHGDSQHSAPVGLQALVIANGLSSDQRPEVVRRTGNGNARTGLTGDQLHGDHRVGPTLVQLPGGVKEARTVAPCDSHTVVGV